jgi:hypothetical protein
VGTVYFPGDPANQGEKLTFTVVNGAVNNWLGYISGECTPTLESVYIQGPAPIVSGVVAKGEKTTPEADKPGYYTSRSVGPYSVPGFRPENGGPEIASSGLISNGLSKPVGADSQKRTPATPIGITDPRS